jgi:hypothetical protein
LEIEHEESEEEAVERERLLEVVKEWAVEQLEAAA